MSIFETLYEVDVTPYVEHKGGLDYVSWANAWAEVKKRFPDAQYTIYENRDGLFYHSDGRTAWVKTGVTIGGLEHIEYLPVMDFKNKSIPLDNITSMNVNTAIQRSLTKAIARHGLGLRVYSGEDLKYLDENKTQEADDPMVRLQALKYINEHCSKESITKICNYYKVDSVNQMTTDQCKDYLKQLEENNK